jgi:hypothetical protein
MTLDPLFGLSLLTSQAQSYIVKRPCTTKISLEGVIAYRNVAGREHSQIHTFYKEKQFYLDKKGHRLIDQNLHFPSALHGRTRVAVLARGARLERFTSSMLYTWGGKFQCSEELIRSQRKPEYSPCDASFTAPFANLKFP